MIKRQLSHYRTSHETCLIHPLTYYGIACFTTQQAGSILYTAHRKILAGEKLANLVNHELFAKNFPHQ